MEEIARKNREIEQLQKKIEEQEYKIQDLEEENHMLKQQLLAKTEEDKAVWEKVPLLKKVCYFAL